MDAHDAYGDEPADAADRDAAEAELAAMTSTDMILQSAVLLINVGGRRLGLAAATASPEDAAMIAAERDLEQVRDAIDSVRALLGVLERRLGDELRPLRDALSQLQMAYAREVSATGAGADAPPAPPTEPEQPQQPAGEGDSGGAASQDPAQGQRRPGPAESSGRLWVPGR
jgi:hypothetical protein